MQFRSTDHNDNQVDKFLDRSDYHRNGARVGDAFSWLNREGGGGWMFGFDGQSLAGYGMSARFDALEDGSWRQSNIAVPVMSVFAATDNGGPYITLDGVNQRLRMKNVPTAFHSTTLNFLVWGWAKPATVSSDMAMISFWDASGNDRSWYLGISSSTSGFIFNTSDDGTNERTADSTVALEVDTWYFAAGLFVPSTVVRVYVATAYDTSVSYDDETSSVFAELEESDANLTLGSTDDPTDYWDGSIGVISARGNVPSANINSHVTRLFQETRWFYQE